jgi:hypothetical protein
LADEVELPSFVFQTKGVAAMRGLEKPVHPPKTGRPEGLPRTAAITRICEQKKAPQYAMGCGQCSPGFPDLIADLAATHKAYPFPV